MKQIALDFQEHSPLDRRRAARLLAAAALAALMAGAALPTAADSVSNLHLSPSPGLDITVDYPSAQGFTTGRNDTGYTLQSITLKLRAKQAGVNRQKMPTVTLHSSASGAPGASALATLNSPPGELPGDGRTWADLVFTCTTNCGLTTTTSYFVVVTPSHNFSLARWAQNQSVDETNTPDDGWSIADVAKYRNGSGGNWLDESPARVKLMTVTYAASPNLWVENIKSGTVRLQLRNSTGAWSWKVTGGARSTCHNSRGPEHSVFQLLVLSSPSTSFTVTAHSGAGCASANLLDTETFTTQAEGWKHPALSVSNIGSTSATLSIANHTGDWWYVDTVDTSTCTKVNAGASASLSGLTANTSYQYEAYSAAGCDDATAPLAWVTEKLVVRNAWGTVSASASQSIPSTWATLTVTGIDSDKWSYKHAHSYPNPELLASAAPMTTTPPSR